MNNKRILDIAAAVILQGIFCIPMLIVAVMVKITSKGPVLHWSDRIGINNSTFRMPKFRTMRTETPAVATHMLEDPDKYLTPIGPFLRRLSLDELPQLWSVLMGDMSFVGPRPALYNQDDLVELRTRKGVDKLVPGITGWAQVNGRDNLAIPVKVEYDEHYLKNRSFLFDLKILLLTFNKVIKREGIKH
ncbi:MAG: sugar transferase [Deltaproteobacteria bacterium]